MGVTPIRIRTRAKAGKTIIIIRTMDEGTIRILPPPQVNKPQTKKKVDLEEELAHMLTSHTTFMNETKANAESVNPIE